MGFFSGLTKILTAPLRPGAALANRLPGGRAINGALAKVPGPFNPSREVFGGGQMPPQAQQAMSRMPMMAGGMMGRSLSDAASQGPGGSGGSAVAQPDMGSRVQGAMMRYGLRRRMGQPEQMVE
jgi:hypothetical protein